MPKARPKPEATPPSPRRATWGAPRTRASYTTSSRRSSRRARSASLDAAKLKELGLDTPTRKLEVTVKGDVRRYDIGQPANATGGEAFLRDTRDGRVYLMPRAMLSELQNAGPWSTAACTPSTSPDFDRISSPAGGKSKEFVQVGRESRATAGFAPAKTPDKRDQMAKNWHDSLWRAFPTELLGKGEEPPGGKPTLVLRVDYFDGKDSVGWMEIAHGRTTAGGYPRMASGSDGDVYVRSEHTAGWNKIPSGGQLVADAQKLASPRPDVHRRSALPKAR